jgi:type IV pilus assembly protein PilE
MNINVAQKSGFSLIEILIALAIIGILAAIAYPSYYEHVVKMHRNLAAVALTDLAGRIEQYYAANNKYSGATLENLKMNTDSCKGFYQLSIVAKDNEYVLRAAPMGKQLQSDILCGALALNQAGEKSISGTGSAAECWQ